MMKGLVNILRFIIFLLLGNTVYSQDYYLDFETGDNVETGIVVTELNGATKFTLEAKVVFDSWTGAVNIFKKFNTLDNRISFQINNGQIFGIVANGQNANKRTSGSVLSLGRWHHIAMVYDGSLSVTNRVKLFLDGVELTNLQSYNTLPVLSPINNDLLVIGGGNFGGKIDEVRVWGEALTAASINAWKNASLSNAHPNYQDLVLYWDLNDFESPFTATASNGSTYNGIITGAAYSNAEVIDPNNVEKPFVGVYLPYYKISSVSAAIFNHLTHVFYFSFGPSASGELGRVDGSGNFTHIDNISTVVSDINTIKAWRGEKTTKIFVTVGGWVQSDYLDEVAANSTARDNLAQNVKEFCTTHGLNGVDIDWEGYKGAVNDTNYGLLISAFKNAFSGTSLEVSTTINPDHTSLADEFAQADFIQLMSYGKRISNGTQVPLSMLQDFVNNWVNAGMPKYKIVAGLPAFARTNADNTSITYRHIVDTYNPGPSVDNVNENGKTYYFNGVNSIQQKAQYVVDNDLLGVVFWEVGQDADINHAKSLLKATTTIIPVNNSLSTKDYANNNKAILKTYPNPFTDKTHIDIQRILNAKNIAIYSLTGSLIFKLDVMNTTKKESNNSYQIDLSHLNNGVYILKIEDIEGEAYSRKIIKHN